MMKSKRGLWRALESLAGGAVMAEWALELGDEFECSRHWLRPNGSTAKDHPCTNRFPCECRHRVEPSRPGVWMAVCDCGGCPPIRLNEEAGIALIVATHNRDSVAIKAHLAIGCSTKQEHTGGHFSLHRSRAARRLRSRRNHHAHRERHYQTRMLHAFSKPY